MQPPDDPSPQDEMQDEISEDDFDYDFDDDFEEETEEEIRDLEEPHEGDFTRPPGVVNPEELKPDTDGKASGEASGG